MRIGRYGHEFLSCFNQGAVICPSRCCGSAYSIAAQHPPTMVFGQQIRHPLEPEALDQPLRLAQAAYVGSQQRGIGLLQTFGSSHQAQVVR